MTLQGYTEVDKEYKPCNRICVVETQVRVQNSISVLTINGKVKSCFSSSHLNMYSYIFHFRCQIVYHIYPFHKFNKCTSDKYTTKDKILYKNTSGSFAFTTCNKFTYHMNTYCWNSSSKIINTIVPVKFVAGKEYNI